jgi:hydroxylaminobenzene mutase
MQPIWMLWHRNVISGYFEEYMDTSDLSLRQARRLFQVGISLFLVALLVGLIVPLFAVPRLGLSAHLIGILQGIFLVVLGLLWPKLTLGRVTSRVAFWLSIYGCISPWTANVLGAVWGAGNTMLPMAAGQAHGTPFQEGLITILLRGGAVSLIAAVVLILWALRAVDDRSSNR